jgi:hypothetical protein
MNNGYRKRLLADIGPACADVGYWPIVLKNSAVEAERVR